MPMPSRVAVLLALIVSAGAAEAGVGDPAAFFAQRIRPLLQESCWRCHGPARQRGGLRLDSRAAVLQGGRTPVVVPGDPARSRLIDAIGYDDPDLQMPPDGRLGAREIADLTAWVRLGVPWAPAASAAGGGQR